MVAEHKSINCITGWEDHLLDHLMESFRKAQSIDIIVAFLRESGVALIINELADAVKRGTTIRILTGKYLNITEPSALYLLKDRLGSDVNLRFFSEEDISFHPKAYICCHDEDGELYIGSSNISKSALTSGLEWNYRLTKKENARDFNFFQKVFEELYNGNP